MKHETNAWNFWHFPALPNLLCAILFTTSMTQRSPCRRPGLCPRGCYRPDIKRSKREQHTTLGWGTQGNSAVLLRYRDSTPSLLVAQLTFFVSITRATEKTRRIWDSLEETLGTQ